MISKFNHVTCWGAFYRSDERASWGRNTRLGGYCGEKTRVRRGIAIIAAFYPIPGKNQIRCGWANLDHTIWGGLPRDSGRHAYIGGDTPIDLPVFNNFLFKSYKSLFWLLDLNSTGSIYPRGFLLEEVLWNFDFFGFIYFLVDFGTKPGLDLV